MRGPRQRKDVTVVMVKVESACWRLLCWLLFQGLVNMNPRTLSEQQKASAKTGFRSCCANVLRKVSREV